MLRGSAVWLLIIFLESLHGTVRELVLTPLIGDLLARQISFFTALIIIYATAITCIRWVLHAESRKQLLMIGALWAALTFCFEFLIGRYIVGLSLERIFADYNLFEGRLMGLGLFLLFLAPFIAARLRGVENA